MKLLIQLNFGLLGNFYIATTQLLHFVNHYKKLGYECNLIFASTCGGKNGTTLELVVALLLLLLPPVFHFISKHNRPQLI